MRWSPALCLAPAPFTFGCAVAGGLCSGSQAISTSDGGVYRCVKAEDCPRPGNLLICTTTEDHARDCVETACQRFSRTACDGGRP